MLEEMEKIENKRFGEERALYALKDAEVISCSFEGDEDGESALKECREVKIKDSKFLLRYPLWHAEDYILDSSYMDITSRAPIWYSKRGNIVGSEINGVKCLRECDETRIEKCLIVSPEFGWRCRGVEIIDSDITSEYFLFESRNLKIDNLKMKGKYSFQYVEDAIIENSVLDTKDAFWHSKNVTVKNSIVKGEYLGWYSENLTLENCKIIGTQPLCYCKNLRLLGCTMEKTDLSFEYSEVRAEIFGEIESVKNPISGKIVADGYGEVIFENSVFKTECLVITR